MRQYGVGDLLVETPYGALTGRSVFDGSLWSLRFELACYLALFVLAVLGTRRRLRLTVGVGAALVAVASVLQWLPRDRYGVGPTPLATPVLPLLGALDPSTAAPMSFAFAVGALVAVFPTQLAMGRWPALVALGTFAGTLEFGAFDVVGVPAFAYVVLFLGSRAPAALRNVGIRTDISYGVYIYGFPIEQLLALNGVPEHGHVLYLGASIALALVAGWISWHVVESHALRLKSWRPGGSRRTSPAGHPSPVVAAPARQPRYPATDPAGMM
jgi:peptidoglycan/LPS O-acetylase OafA/YrhL